MRFGSTFLQRLILIGLLAMGVATAFATPNPAFDLSTPPPTTERYLRTLPQGTQIEPQARADLTLSEAATRLGHVTALTALSPTEIFAVSPYKNRIYRLTDRDSDGNFERITSLEVSLNFPTGAAHYNREIYFSDQTAIWKLNPKTLQVEPFVSLSNSSPLPESLRPLAINPLDGTMYLGLSYDNGRSYVIEIDPVTRKASTYKTLLGQITNLAINTQGQIFATTNDHVSAVNSTEFTTLIEGGSNISGLYIPGQGETPKSWPTDLSDAIIVTQSNLRQLSPQSSGGRNIIAIPTRLGLPQSKFTILVDGFLNNRKDGAWGQPGPLLMTADGLLFMENRKGVLWRINPALPKDILPQEVTVTAPVPQAETPETSAPLPYSLNTYDAKDPRRPIGSQIESASKIPFGSSIPKVIPEGASKKDKIKTEEPD